MKEKKCGRCEEVKNVECFNKNKYSKSGLRSQCKDCMKKERADLKYHYKAWRNSEEKKAWYAKYRRDRYQKDKKKVKARNAARVIKRKPCEVCGATDNIHAHHDDYDKPLDVRFLCLKHHAEWHADNGEGLNP